MSERIILHFELLGSFSYEGRSLKSGRKALSFLQYLIVHHERNISAEELIEEFWPEHSSDPGSALRRLLYKVREMLEEMFPGRRDLLRTLPGCYAWDPGVSLELDTERFEAACLEAGKKEEDGQTEALLLAVSMYKGDFLSSNDSHWALGLRQYYRALYLDACRKLLPLLEKGEMWIELLSVCEQASRVDFTVEEFTICQMQALIALGQPEQAVEKYEVFRNRMLKELETEPSGRAQQLGMLAAGLCKNELGVSDIFGLLQGEDEERRAFFCTFEMFRSIVLLEKRHLYRSGEHSTLVIASLGRGSVPGTDARRLERILLEGLRAGDPVARLGAGSYIFMLAGAGVEQARLAVSRLDCAFHKTYRHSRTSVTYHLEELFSGKESK